MAKREISEDQRARMVAAAAARRETREHIIQIGEYQIFQSDPDNWILRKGTDGDPRYYPTLAWCLKMCLHHAIGDKVVISGSQSKSIREVLAAVQKSEATIMAAVAK